MSDKTIRDASLEYHRQPPPGKISVTPTKQLTNQRDLALAYTPGVAAACDEIVRDPRRGAKLTARGNLIGVITNGTAVLGLGAIGPLAAKPVMEGKAVLFKKFAGIDCFDIEIDERDPRQARRHHRRARAHVRRHQPRGHQGARVLLRSSAVRERMKIPVFHDDQHGTAIIVGAAIVNGLRVVGKDIGKVKLVCSGAGAAALACLDLLVALGMRGENICVTDIEGVVYKGRTEEMDDNKARYAQQTDARTLAEVIAAPTCSSACPRRRAEAGMVRDDGAVAADPGARQSRARDPAGAREGGAARRGHRHRPLRLPEPGEQRPVLPVHLPRRARRRRHHASTRR